MNGPEVNDNTVYEVVKSEGGHSDLYDNTD